MNAVDLADQRRAAYTVHQRARRNWLSLFFWFLDVSLVNAHLLYELARQEQFSKVVDAGSIALNQVASHPLGKCCEPVKFREVLAKQLLPAPFKSPNRVVRIRRTYIKKTAKIYFSRHARDLPLAPIRQPRWTAGDTNVHWDSTNKHHLERMDKRRSCVICWLDLRNHAERVKGMHFRRRTSYECRECSPPVALCGPQGELGSADSGCFIRGHQR